MQPVTTPHRARARFTGTMEWLCPWCGHINRSRVQRGQWRVTCKHEVCRKVVGLGLLMYDLSALKRLGKAVPPPDDMMFPAVPVTPVPAGQRIVHVVDVPA